MKARVEDGKMTEKTFLLEARDSSPGKFWDCGDVQRFIYVDYGPIYFTEDD